MITKNEVTALNLSPIKKDFVQIWNELLDVAGKLSERWDPTSTNESDPGIVILKALTGIADRLNYNIDKNILEAFMPTAAQEESMRKLCEMMGYNMKYFQSAEVDVTIRHSNPDPSEDERKAFALGPLYIPKFTVIKSADNEINYFTTEATSISLGQDTTVKCLEGQVVKCESLLDNNVVTLNQLTSNNRFYFPEVQIAENGIFVYSVTTATGTNSLIDGLPWAKVDNLNTHARSSYVFKFGFDSYEGRPYIEFPDDIGELINDGLFIYYTRTSGINGNISTRSLTQIELPKTDDWQNVPAESFLVENTLAATSGTNTETINQAYNNFKKTIGTFDTLVTCRDYMNKIYNMTKPNSIRNIVSKALVTDIRNDINKAITICSCDDSGICYKEKPLVNKITEDHYKPVYSNGTWYIGYANSPFILSADHIISENTTTGFDFTKNGDVFSLNGKWAITQKSDRETFNTFTTNLDTLETDSKLIDHFDLVFYPFKSYNQITSSSSDIEALYERSFEYYETDLPLIESQLKSSKTIAHNITKPNKGDIISINNYLRLNAFIATTNKITAEEGNLIIDKIKMALANAFNMRELDFGEEIPFEQILEVIENADPRIKVASLNEPTLYTTFSVLEGTKETLNSSVRIPRVVEYAVASSWLEEAEATKLSKMYERDILTELASADFGVEKEDGKAIFYTYIDGVKNYLGVYLIEERDQDACLCFTTDKDAAAKWQCETKNSKFVWTTEIKIDESSKKYFLGSYGEKTNIYLSRESWLNAANADSNEHLVAICESTDIPAYVSTTMIDDVVTNVIDLDSNTSYKLFTLAGSPKYIYYVLPKVAANNRSLLSTAKPVETEAVYDTRFLFNTNEAKNVYNKLALRNILAGRVALFNYENTFETNFDENAYLITEIVDSESENIDTDFSTFKEAINSKVNQNNPFEISPVYFDNKGLPVIYTCQCIAGELKYTKTYCPYPTVINKSDSSIINKLSAECTIPASDNIIENVELTSGEVIKFRAPNFVTTATYPAYVNYHLQLAEPVSNDAVPATGSSLHNILEYGNNTNWNKLFTELRKSDNKNAVKTFTATLTIEPFEEDIPGGTQEDEESGKGVNIKDITVSGLEQSSESEIDISAILNESGCIRIIPQPAKDGEVGGGFDEANNKICLVSNWATKVEDGEAIGKYDELPIIKLTANASGTNTGYNYIKSESKYLETLEAIKETIYDLRKNHRCDEENNTLYKDEKVTIEEIVIEDGNVVYDPDTGLPKTVQKEVDVPIPALPTGSSWTVSITFEYAPLNTITLEQWIDCFKKYCDSARPERLKFDGLKGLSPTGTFITQAEHSNSSIFYRLYSGYSYEVAKYVTESGEKFIALDRQALHNMSDCLNNTYILSNYGQDQVSNIIENGTEYQLKDGETLYINYTPSSTTADGTATVSESVNKVYTKGTIIRPSGFDTGLVASEVLSKSGTSYTKHISFSQNTDSTALVGLHSLGANEQIEIRDFAEVELSQDTLKNNSSIYIYKNFDCPILEGNFYYYDDNPDVQLFIKQRNYTLRDGEYIFYTDANKAEMAYFTSGTLVSLVGPGTIIPRSDKIDIGSILENGFDYIPWEKITLSAGKKIKFTEYQYTTLGNGDTLGKLTLLSSGVSDTEAVLNQEWKPLQGDIYYYAANDTAKENKIRLSPIKTVNPNSDIDTKQTLADWNGWEACSLLELSVSAKQAQTLRVSPKIGTRLAYSQENLNGAVANTNFIDLANEDIVDPLNINPISFKTNINCIAIGSTADQNTLHPAEAKEAINSGFAIKTFTSTEPLIVGTIAGKTTPHDVTSWIRLHKLALAEKLAETDEAVIGYIEKTEFASHLWQLYGLVADLLGDEETFSSLLDEELEQLRVELLNAVEILTYYITNFAEVNTVEDTLFIQKILANSDFISKIDAVQNLNGDDEEKLTEIRNKAKELSKESSLYDVITKANFYDITKWRGQTLEAKDFNDIWSRVSLAKIKVDSYSQGLSSNELLNKSAAFGDCALKLPVLVTDDTYGIATFYVSYTVENTDNSMKVWIELPEGYSEEDISLVNAETNWEASAAGSGLSNKLYLNPGINCVKVNKSCDLFIKATKEAQGELFFDSLRLVRVQKMSDNTRSKGLNLGQIQYQYVKNSLDSSNTSEELLIEDHLLQDLRAADVDREFYYNAPIDSTLAIEFNETRIGRDSLMNPTSYYDLNNMNNPFVISKLDIDYLDTGIQIARTSRIN